MGRRKLDEGFGGGEGCSSALPDVNGGGRGQVRLTPPPSPLENVIPIPTPAGILVTLAPTPTSNTQSPAPVRIPAGRTLSQSPYPPLQNPAISYPFPSPSPLGRGRVGPHFNRRRRFKLFFSFSNSLWDVSGNESLYRGPGAPYKTAQTLILTRRRHYFHQWTKSEFFWASLLLTNGFSKFAIESQDGTRSRMSQRSSHLKSRTIHEFVKA
ncbi:hypothetical protein PHJA_002931400 [Phtheirospermum japonicum]|uniref:Uncharacterized protein n=1 Tax=Phtheirospermum japonicum TaxID=374723 RepID=A0A830DJY9_9LAMI|nr:hypothetical protein PHJA_002931400 [Phtheirospermum japonicum]